MDRLALTGLAVALAGALALLAGELIGTAHAGRPAERTYLMALSGGSSLQLVARSAEQRRTIPLATTQPATRHLTCTRILEVTSVSLGFKCRGGY